MIGHGEPWCRDGISIRDLQFQTPPTSGLDAWGREKEQPVLLSVHLSFKAAFESAADNDALDASTMHYGVLAKNLRKASSNQWGSLDDLVHLVRETVSNTPPGLDIVEQSIVEVKLPKASLMGEAVVYSVLFPSEGSASRILHLQNLCIPTLIGVNANERLAKQKLVVNVWIGGIAHPCPDTYTLLEQALISIIEPTAFETLESLAIHVLRKLYKAYAPLQEDGTTVRLRLEKPQAVPFAAAPAIELFRTSLQLRAVAQS